MIKKFPTCSDFKENESGFHTCHNTNCPDSSCKFFNKDILFIAPNEEQPKFPVGLEFENMQSNPMGDAFETVRWKIMARDEETAMKMFKEALELKKQPEVKKK